MYEIGQGEPPFLKYKNTESLFAAVADADKKDIRCPNQSDAFNDMILKCMAKEARDRPTMKQVL